jgi:membrane protease YdiL (CAAX protease family)
MRGNIFTALLALELATVLYYFAKSILLELEVQRDPNGATAKAIEDAARGLDPNVVLFLNQLLLLLAAGIIPFLLFMGTRNRPVEGTKRALRLHRPGKAIPTGLAVGVGAVFALAIVVALAVSVYAALSNQSVQNVTDANRSEVTERLQAQTPIWLAAFLSLGAGFTEEFVFRGLLQRWLSRFGSWTGVILPTIAFGLIHFTYGTALQIVGPMVLGLGFAILVRRGFPLWFVMAAHAAFDFVALTAGRLPPG